LISTGIQKEMFVPAAPGDNGLSVGACFLAWKQINPSFKPVKVTIALCSFTFAFRLIRFGSVHFLFL
jgi:hypothetical protein